MRQTFTLTLLHFLAECEAWFMHPYRARQNSYAWRRRELKHLGVAFGNEVFVARSLFILRRGGITLGDRCALGSHVQLVNHAPITIGKDFIGASDLLINSGLHDPVTLQPSGAPITIGDRVWCGVRVTILGGARIGSDVVIGAGSVVTGDIPSNCVAAGVPARVLRPIDRTGINLWSVFGGAPAK